MCDAGGGLAEIFDWASHPALGVPSPSWGRYLLEAAHHNIHRHVSEAHLQRYLYEFDFRHSNRAKVGVNDEMRAEGALRGIVGKRLTYRRTNQGSQAQA